MVSPPKYMKSVIFSYYAFVDECAKMEGAFFYILFDDMKIGGMEFETSFFRNGIC